MVNFGGYYTFSADQVEYISATSSDDLDYPYSLSAYLKSGKMLAISYKTEKARDTAKSIMVNRIESELKQTQNLDRLDAIHSRILLLERMVERIDKRQLRIWRQLKALLRLTGDNEE